jgi:hypothetical protein
MAAGRFLAVPLEALRARPQLLYLRRLLLRTEPRGCVLHEHRTIYRYLRIASPKFLFKGVVARSDAAER